MEIKGIGQCPFQSAPGVDAGGNLEPRFYNNRLAQFLSASALMPGETTAAGTVPWPYSVSIRLGVYGWGTRESLAKARDDFGFDPPPALMPGETTSPPKSAAI